MRVAAATKNGWMRHFLCGPFHSKENWTISSYQNFSFQNKERRLKALRNPLQFVTPSNACVILYFQATVT
jgi:Ni,Fe-hydrogenase I cytochrome b subunit